MEEKKNNAVEKAENIAKEVKKEDGARESFSESVFGTDEKTAKRIHRREEKERARAAAKREKERAKREKAIARENSMERKKGKKEGKNNSAAGWITAVVSLGVVTIALAAGLSFALFAPSENDGALENGYRLSFYDAVQQSDNIDLNLSKALATSDGGAMQKYLVDTAINSELLESDLQRLPLRDENKFYTAKVVNQIGDYAKYLNNKITDGELLTDEDVAGLLTLYQANKSLKSYLSDMAGRINGEFTFASFNQTKGNLVVDGFGELQNLSVEYPELIYDGPFSDGITREEIKGLSGEEIRPAIALNRFAEDFKKTGFSRQAYVGESFGEIECFNVQATIKGELMYAQYSKIGGKLIMFSYAGSCKAKNITRDEAIDIGLDLLVEEGIEGMRAVWVNENSNVYTINYAYCQNGVIVYPDLIKIRICAETGMPIGYEASSYYTNHTARLISSPALGEDEALEKVSANIDVETSRLALVPVGTKSEKLCYEFSGYYDGERYFVYIDAASGRQVEMFKVIDSEDGELLM